MLLVVAAVLTDSSVNIPAPDPPPAVIPVNLLPSPYKKDADNPKLAVICPVTLNVLVAALNFRFDSQVKLFASPPTLVII